MKNLKWILLLLIFVISTRHVIGREDPPRLILTDTELEEIKCSLVSRYYDFKRYVSVIANNSEEPDIRNSNAISLVRLLSPDFKGGSHKFVDNLRKSSDEYALLHKNYTQFDCPDVRVRVDGDPSKDLSETELKKIVDADISHLGSEVKTTMYFLLLTFAETNFNSYDIDKTLITSSSHGIVKQTEIKQIKYRVFKLAEDEIILRIESISEDLSNTALKKIAYNKDSTTYLVNRKPQIKDFQPCCEEKPPLDGDGDGYNFLVDCDDSNKSIYPGSLEIPDDGIDQDCDGSDQKGADNDGDGYTSTACNSPDPEIRKLCDCYDHDDTVYPRTTSDFNPYNGWNDDNCDCIKDETPPFKWTNLSRLDYLLVGKGHLVRGHPNKINRVLTSTIYASAFAGSAVYASISKWQSNKYYNLHKSATTLRVSDNTYETANKHHKRFLISTGVAAAVFAGQYWHLKIKDSRQEQYYREAFDKESERELDSKDFCIVSVKPSVHSNAIGIGLYYEF